MHQIPPVDTLDSQTLAPKLRGGYYTPTAIALFLAAWAIRSADDQVLEPSCGDGALVVAAAERLLSLGATRWAVAQQLKATELFLSEADLARQRLNLLGLDGSAVVHTGDFFSHIASHAGTLFAEDNGALAGLTFDVALGNPPFIRSQAFPEEQRQRAFAEMRRPGLMPNRLTNAWVPFLIASAERLTAKGRLAMVIPAELLQVGYAGETRAYLARQFASVTIVTFRKLVFSGIQQEVVLLLAERGLNSAHTIDIVELDDADDLPTLLSERRVSNAHKPLLQAKDKWTQYFLNSVEIELIQHLNARPDIPRVGDFARVEVGIVTGNNAFFVQRETDVVDRGLADVVHPLVGRTAQLTGLLHTPADHEAQRRSGAGCWLLALPEATPLSASSNTYVQEGERQQVHTGYKCRIRPTWYCVPSVWAPDAFMFRQIYRFPKIVANLAGATSTDTIHRVRFKPFVDKAQFSGAFYNVLTFAFAEIIGRSYGGGVLEIEPGEAGHLPVPFFEDVKLDIEHLDALERAGKGQQILDITNAILQNKLGLDAADCQRLLNIWKKLSERRVGRKAATRKSSSV